ncbi:hypothetical protein C8Q74DRAFT_353748 [Fomes fomentarius]|nr:hypothetical protein C8Q74DRAFT_353748 [Fomes fomentarius]
MGTNQEQKNAVEALLHSQSVCHLELQAPREFFHVVRHLKKSIAARRTHSLILNVCDAEDLVPDLLRVTFPCVKSLVLNLSAQSLQLVDAIRSYISDHSTKLLKLSVAFHPSPLASYPSPYDNALALPHVGDAPESLPRTTASATPIILVSLSSGLRICHVQMERSEGLTSADHHSGDLAGRILQAAPIKALTIQMTLRHSPFSALSSLLFPLDTAYRLNSQLDSMEINITVDKINDSRSHVDRSLELAHSIVSHTLRNMGIFNLYLNSTCTHTAGSPCNATVVYDQLRHHYHSIRNIPNRIVSFVVSSPCASEQPLSLS